MRRNGSLAAKQSTIFSSLLITLNVCCLVMSFLKELPALTGSKVDENSETEPKQ